MADKKLTKTENNDAENTPKTGEPTNDAENTPKTGEPTNDAENTPKTGEPTNDAENTPKKGKLTNRKYSTLLDAAKANGIDSDRLKNEAVKRLNDVISTAYESIKRLHESKTPVSDFIKMSRAEQSNKVLQISSGSLEQRLGYDRETYTSVKTATTTDEAVIYTLLACIGWDATARLCGIDDATTAKKSKSETNSTVTLDF